jgi:serine/threonine protein kinase
MTPEQWQRAKAVLTAAMRLDTSRQQALIRREFPESQVRQEVEELLTNFTLASLRLPWLHEPPATDGAAISTTLLTPSSRPGHTFAPGEMCGRYEVVRLLGAGGEGRVYLAKDSELSTDVALKVMSDELIESSEARIRLRGGAHNAAKLRGHPHIATLLDLIHVDVNGRQLPVVVMEYVEGKSCADHLNEHPISLARAMRWATQIAEAVEFAHDHGVLHCDLKPQNVQVTSDDNVKVLDFGISRALYGPSKAETIRGTLAYMAPEQVRDGQFTEAGDIYSLGVTIFELVTRCRPFTADTPQELVLRLMGLPAPRCSSLVADVPEALDQLLDRALAKATRNRPQSVAGMRQTLAELRDSFDQTLTKGRRWALLSTVGCSILAAATLAGYVTSRVFNSSLGRTARFDDDSPLWWPVWGLRMLFAPLMLSTIVLIPTILVAAAVYFAARRLGWSRAARMITEPVSRLPLERCALLVLTGSATALYLFVWRFTGMFNAFPALIDDASETADFAVLRPENFAEHNLYRYAAFLLIVAQLIAWAAIAVRRARRSERIGLVAPIGGVILLSGAVTLWAIPYRLLWHTALETVHVGGALCYVAGQQQSDLLLFCPVSRPRTRMVPMADPRIDRRDSRIETRIFRQLDTNPNTP